MDSATLWSAVLCAVAAASSSDPASAILSPVSPTGPDSAMRPGLQNSLESAVCGHDLQPGALVVGAEEVLLHWRPFPRQQLRACRELEISLASGPLANLTRLSADRLLLVSCRDSQHLLTGLRGGRVYSASLTVLRHFSGLFCRGASIVSFAMAGSTADQDAIAGTTVAPESRHEPSSAAEALLFALVLGVWALALAKFIHKLQRLRIGRATADSLKHMRPLNIEQVRVCKEPTDTVIYRSYAKDSRMSACLEERQARVTHLRRLYAEELQREVEELEQQRIQLCGLRQLRSQLAQFSLSARGRAGHADDAPTAPEEAAASAAEARRKFCLSRGQLHQSDSLPDSLRLTCSSATDCPSQPQAHGLVETQNN